jgi:hypothetical protein
MLVSSNGLLNLTVASVVSLDWAYIREALPQLCAHPNKLALRRFDADWTYDRAESVHKASDNLGPMGIIRGNPLLSFQDVHQHVDEWLAWLESITTLGNK